MRDEHLDDALRDLRTELNVTPSPEFAAKVRERIEAQPATARWGLWAWTGVAATCVAAVIAVAMWRAAHPAPVTQKPVASVAQSVQAPEPAAAVTPPAAEPVAPKRPATPAEPTVRVARERAEPEVLVPPDQLNAIRRLMAAVRKGALASAPAAPTLIDPDTGELIPPKPIEIPLITIEPLPGLPDGKSGGSERQ
jgi:hypothetical protein